VVVHGRASSTPSATVTTAAVPSPEPVAADIVPGAKFPDYELTDANKQRQN
jgi:hypothetical protein